MCDLCKGPETNIEEEHEYYWVAYCRSCNVLMAWSREHTMPTNAHSQMVYGMMLKALRQTADRLYAGGYRIDIRQQRIPDHMHIHARPMIVGYGG